MDSPRLLQDKAKQLASFSPAFFPLSSFCCLLDFHCNCGWIDSCICKLWGGGGGGSFKPGAGGCVRIWTQLLGLQVWRSELGLKPQSNLGLKLRIGERILAFFELKIEFLFKVERASSLYLASMHTMCNPNSGPNFCFLHGDMRQDVVCNLMPNTL